MNGTIYISSAPLAAGCLAEGTMVQLGAQVGLAGAEGRVHEVRLDHDQEFSRRYLAKIHHRIGTCHIPPVLADLVRNAERSDLGHVAFPQATLHVPGAESGDAPVGYLMARFESAGSLSAITLRQRNAVVQPRDLMMLLAGVAAGIDRLHRQCVVIGDLAPRNILLSNLRRLDRAKIAFIDALSYQFWTGKKFLPPRSWESQLSSPSLRRDIEAKGVEQATRLPIDDAYAFAGLCFQLVTGGYHPFQCQRCDQAAGQQSKEQNMAEGYFPYTEGRLPPGCNPRAAFLFGRLPVAIRDLMTRTFQRLATPTMTDWLALFDREVRRLGVQPVALATLPR